MAYFNTPSTFSQPAYNNFHTLTQPVEQYPMGTQTNSIIWVQGEAAARSYPVLTRNTSVLLMDSEGDTFYIKSTDASGMPLPLRTFDYMERVNAPAQNTEVVEVEPKEDLYVTKEEFEARMKEFASRIRRSETKKEGKK